MPFAATWMHLEITIPSELSQTKTNICRLRVESKIWSKGTRPWDTDPQTEQSAAANGEGLQEGRLGDFWSLWFVVQSLSRVRLFCDPVDCSPPGSSVHGDSPAKNTGMGCHALLQRIFLTQGLNPGLPHCRWIFYQLSHQGSPIILEWVAISFSRGTSWPRNQTQASCLGRWILYHWVTREARFEISKLYTGWINNKVLLYSVQSHNGKEYEKEW